MLKGAENRKTESATRMTCLRVAGKIARGTNCALTALTAIFLILVLLFACYALWDTWRIYDGANIDDDLLKYKPTLDNTESLAELMKINPDVCAWLTIDDTSIDYPVVQGITLMLVAVFLLVNLLVDVLYAFIDPRIRYE